MRTLLLIILCTLISSCSIFKKTTKVTDFVSGSEVVKIEQGKAEQVKTSEGESVKESEKTETEGSRAIEADEIIIHSDGSITAKGNAKANVSNKSKGEKQKDATQVAETQISLQEYGKASSETKIVEKHRQSESKPSGKGIMFGAIAVLIVALGVMWYLGVK